MTKAPTQLEALLLGAREIVAPGESSRLVGGHSVAEYATCSEMGRPRRIDGRSLQYRGIKTRLRVSSHTTALLRGEDCHIVFWLECPLDANDGYLSICWAAAAPDAPSNAGDLSLRGAHI